MSFVLEVKRDLDHLLVTARGRVHNLREWVEYVSAIVREATRYGRECVLVDERELSLSLDVKDIFLFAEEKAVDMRFGLDNKFVSVCSKCNEDTMDACELFLRNRNIDFKVFSNMEAARRWIRATQA